MTLAELNALIKRTAKTPADVVVILSDMWIRLRGRYQLAAEPFGMSWGWKVWHWLKGDCSGLIGAILRYAEKVRVQNGWEGRALWNVAEWGLRPTARKFDAMGEPVPADQAQLGDPVIFRRPWRKNAHHVLMVTHEKMGQMMTVESPRRRHTLARVLERRYCQGVKRIPGLNLGEITIPLTLWPGDVGIEVTRLQERLNAWLGPFLTVNGLYDSQTKSAVKLFQQVCPPLPPEPPEETPLLKRQMRHPAVTDAKRLAQAQGFCMDLDATSPDYGPKSAAAFLVYNLAKGIGWSKQVTEATWAELVKYAPDPDRLGLPITDGIAGVETLTALDRDPHYPGVKYRDGTRGGRNQRNLGRLIGKVLKRNMNRHGRYQSTNSWTFWHYNERNLLAIKAANGLPATPEVDEATWDFLLS